MKYNLAKDALLSVAPYWPQFIIDGMRNGEFFYHKYLINYFKSFIDIYKNKITQQMKHNAAAINIAGI